MSTFRVLLICVLLFYFVFTDVLKCKQHLNIGAPI